jgi:hypothetical protein
MSSILRCIVAIAVFFMHCTSISNGAFTVGAPAQGTGAYATNGSVAGYGDATASTAAIFKFGVYDVLATPIFRTENEVALFSSGTMWYGTIPAPQGGWDVSPMDGGQYVHDKFAQIVGADSTSHFTDVHYVYP